MRRTSRWRRVLPRGRSFTRGCSRFGAWCGRASPRQLGGEAGEGGFAFQVGDGVAGQSEAGGAVLGVVQGFEFAGVVDAVRSPWPSGEALSLAIMVSISASKSGKGRNLAMSKARNRCPAPLVLSYL